MTKEDTFGHARRRSQAPSHRSHPSINSDCEQNDGYDDDPTDDSGLGGEVHGNDMLRVRPQVYTTSTYHNNISAGYDTDSFHYR